MAYTIDTSSKAEEIKLVPETLEEEVLQNLWVLYSSVVCDVPLDRGLGLEPSYTDRPLEVAKALVQAEIYDKTEQYEPRAEVTSISFSGPGNTADYMEGRLKPVVEVEINGGNGDSDEDGTS